MAKPASFDCLTCGTAIPQTTGPGRIKKYCSEECLYASRGKTRKTTAKQPCPACKAPVSQSTCASGRSKRYCSTACRWKAKNKGPTTRSCTWCGVAFTSSNGRKRWCSVQCRRSGCKDNAPCIMCGTPVKRRGALCCGTKCGIAYNEMQSALLTCGFCGKTFKKSDTRGAGLYCSRPCSYAAKANAENKARLAAIALSQPSKRLHPRTTPRGTFDHKRRAATFNCVYVSVPYSAVIKRYGRTCWICKKRIEERPSDPLDILSIDHVVPLSLGGWHDLLNIRPAHKRCNTERSNRYFGQLMLKIVA